MPGLRDRRLAGGEERDQLEQRERLAHDALQTGLADAELLAHRRRVLAPRARPARPRSARRPPPPAAPCAAACAATAAGTSSEPSSTLATNSTGLLVSEPRSRGGIRGLLGHRHRARRPALPAARRSPRAATPPRRSPRGRRPRACLPTLLHPPFGRSRSAITSSVSIVSISASGSTRPSGWITFSSLCARTTCTIACVSRMFARNLLPSPSPSCAPATSPAMSWKSTVSHTISDAPTVLRHLLHALVAHRHHRHVWLDRRERVVRRLRTRLCRAR